MFKVIDTVTIALRERILQQEKTDEPTSHFQVRLSI